MVKSSSNLRAHAVQRYGFTELSPGTRGEGDVPLVKYGLRPATLRDVTDFGSIIFVHGLGGKF